MLEEYRAHIGGTYSFCHFKPVVEGNVLDLSYNDVSLNRIKRIVDDYANNSVQEMTDKLLSNPNAYEKYKNSNSLKKILKQL